jgi:hypothetical protein
MSTEYKHITYTRRHMEEALARSDKFYDIEHKKMREVARKLQEENARLRNALTHLTKDPGMFCCDCPDIREFCRDALEGKE